MMIDAIAHGSPEFRKITVELPRRDWPGHIACELEIREGAFVDLWGLLQQPDHPGLRRLLESLGPLGGDPRIPRYSEPEPGTLRHRVEGLLDQLGEHREHCGDFEDGAQLWVLEEQEGETLYLQVDAELARVTLLSEALSNKILCMAELPLEGLNPESLGELLERGRNEARDLLARIYAELSSE
jgi:hypothetical protein